MQMSESTQQSTVYDEVLEVLDNCVRFFSATEATWNLLMWRTASLN